jgi:GNAT superfamily N-acetyltransferase
MHSSVEIVRYESGHKEQVLRLQRHLWGRDPEINQSYFTWKYESNPYLTGPRICLAVDRGEVVGMRGLVGARWLVGASGRAVAIPFADDFVIAPQYRGQGIAAPLLRATLATPSC